MKKFGIAVAAVGLLVAGVSATILMQKSSKQERATKSAAIKGIRMGPNGDVSKLPRKIKGIFSAVRGQKSRKSNVRKANLTPKQLKDIREKLKRRLQRSHKKHSTMDAKKKRDRKELANQLRQGQHRFGDNAKQAKVQRIKRQIESKKRIIDTQ